MNVKQNQIDNDRAKKIMLNLLIKFAKYCNKYEFRYFLAYGTLLGAIRHNGYIPWDNDIDIWMPRPDYNNLIRNTKIHPISEEISCLDYNEVKTFPFLKVIDNRTSLKEYFLVTEKNLGLYIDVFPLDGLPDDKKKRHKIISRSVQLNSLFAFANYRFNTGSSKKRRLIKNVLYPVSRIISSKFVCYALNNLCANYIYDECSYVGSVLWGYYYKEQLLREWFTPSIGVFEGTAIDRKSVV